MAAAEARQVPELALIGLVVIKGAFKRSIICIITVTIEKACVPTPLVAIDVYSQAESSRSFDGEVLGTACSRILTLSLSERRWTAIGLVPQHLQLCAMPAE